MELFSFLYSSNLALKWISVFSGVEDLASAVHGEGKDVNSEAVLGSEEWFVYASSWNLCSSQAPILLMRTSSFKSDIIYGNSFFLSFYTVTNLIKSRMSTTLW